MGQYGLKVIFYLGSDALCLITQQPHNMTAQGNGYWLETVDAPFSSSSTPPIVSPSRRSALFNTLPEPQLSPSFQPSLHLSLFVVRPWCATCYKAWWMAIVDLRASRLKLGFKEAWSNRSHVCAVLCVRMHLSPLCEFNKVTEDDKYYKNTLHKRNELFDIHLKNIRFIVSYKSITAYSKTVDVYCMLPFSLTHFYLYNIKSEKNRLKAFHISSSRP